MSNKTTLASQARVQLTALNMVEEKDLRATPSRRKSNIRLAS